jgi:hypothetical protein
MFENFTQLKDDHMAETFTQPISQHEPGAKMDAEKPRTNLVLGGFSQALLAVSEVGTMGAKKYTDNGWKVVPNGEARYSDALLRHFLEEAAGQAYDAESGLLHAAHTAWNALAILELKLKERKLKSLSFKD